MDRQSRLAQYNIDVLIINHIRCLYIELYAGGGVKQEKAFYAYRKLLFEF